MSYQNHSQSRSSTSTVPMPTYHHSSSSSRSSYHSYRDRDNRHPRRNYSRESSNSHYHRDRSRERRSSGGSCEDRGSRNSSSSYYSNQGSSSRSGRFGDYQSSSSSSYSSRYGQSQSNNYRRPPPPNDRHQSHERIPRTMSIPPPPQKFHQFSTEPNYSLHHNHNVHNHHLNPNHQNVNYNQPPPDPPLPVTPAPIKPPPPPPPEKMLYYNVKLYDEAVAYKAYKKSEKEALDMIRGIPSVKPTKQPGEDDATVISNILDEIKGRGIFDKFRRDCMDAASSMSAYQSLSKQVGKTVDDFLLTAQWREGQNRILREAAREKIVYSHYFDGGIEDILDQVLNPELMKKFIPRVEDVVYSYLGVPTPSEVKAAEEAKNIDCESDQPPQNPREESAQRPNSTNQEPEEDEDSYSPCPSPPGESHHPLPNLNFGSTTATAVIRPVQVPKTNSVLEVKSKSEMPGISCREMDKLRMDTFLASNQEMVSEDEDVEDDEEEESPAFEKFGEFSPPRVNPDELRKQFEIPMGLPPADSDADVGQTSELNLTSEDQNHLPQSRSSYPKSTPTLFLDAIPQLAKKFEFYQLYINPLMMDDDVSVSSVDYDEMEEFDVPIRIKDVALPGNALDWLQTNGARVRLNDLSSPKASPSNGYKQRTKSKLVGTKSPSTRTVDVV